MMPLPRTPSFDLDGRDALVVGGGSGIGLAAAAALAQANAKVTIAARNIENLREVQSRFASEDLSIDIQQLDITHEAEIDAFFSEANVDILVNSAGLARHSPAIETRAQDFDEVMAVNLRAAFFLSRTAAKHLIKREKSGSLINISSQMAFVGGPDRAVYSASKHALSGMTKSMAIEWAPYQIRINTICPTFIRTPLAEQTLSRPERLRWVTEKIKLGRIGEVEDIMGAVLYLASDASALVTGSELLIDGGWTAG